jgi:hypothetical protein
VSSVQDQALAALARRSGLLDAATLERASREEGPLLLALVRAGALGAARASRLVEEASRTGFRCASCGVEWSFAALARFPRLACAHCGVSLEPVAEAPFQGSVARTASSRVEVAPTPVPVAPAPPASAPGAPPPVLPALPNRLGVYELDKVLGRGSMGVVYLARKPGLDRLFALKVLTQAALDDDRTLLARFEREVTVASRLDHPGIVRVLDRGEDRGHFFYAMEYCPGPTLQKRIGAGRLPAREAAEVLRELADAVDAAHRAGVIHRDLKPANVILSGADESGHGGRPRITDFGLARDERSSHRLTRSGDTIGTPYYMAPEQVRSEKDVDGRADVYALGVVLFECLSGKRPFESRSAVDLGKMIVEGARASLRDAAPDVPPGLEAIANKAFSLARGSRYPAAGDLRDDLDRWLRGARPLALPPRALPPLGVLLGGAAVLGALAVLGAQVVQAHSEKELARREAAEKEKRRLEAQVKQGQAERRELDEKLRSAESGARERRSDAFEVWDRLHAAAKGDAAVELAHGRFLLRRLHVAAAAEHARALLEGTLAPAQELEARSLEAGALLATRPLPPERAREALRALLAKDPGGARGLLAKAALDQLDGRTADALRDARASIAREETAEAQAFLARALTTGWETENVIARALGEVRNEEKLGRTDTDARAALAAADRAVELSPDDAGAILARSLVRVRFFVFRWYARDELPVGDEYGRFDEGRRRDLDDAVELAGGEPEPDSLVLRARYRYFFPQYGDAREDLDRALKVRPDDVEALVLRAIAERGGEGATGFFRRALETDERRAWAIVRHFVLFGGNPAALVDKAEQTADVIRRERGETLRRAFLERGQRRAAGAGPAADAVRDALQRAERGEPLEVARAALDRFLAGAAETGPGTAAATLELGRLLLGRGRPADALERFERARSLGADPVETDLLAGEALLRESRREDARARFEAALPKAQGVPKLLALSGVRRAAGDGPGAREAAAAAVREAPGDPEARLAFAEALLVGDLIEPDAARAEARWALAIAGRSDAEALVLATLGDALAVVATPRSNPADLELARSILGNSSTEVDRLARSANARVRVALAFLRLPHAGAHQLGLEELDAARRFDPPGAERLRRNDPELARALGD